jgi:hypothetical protein
MINENNPFAKWLTVEDREHIEVVEYLTKYHNDKVWFHIPNEGKKSSFERYKHSLMGARKGMPDFCILHPKTKPGKEQFSNIPFKEVEYYGLLIELKAPERMQMVLKGKMAGTIKKTKGKVSKEQSELLKTLSAKKYKAIACFGAHEAIKEIQEYFS